MADNTTLTTMTGGDVIATDDIGGVKHQRVKVGHGVDGAYADATPAAPLPVSGPVTLTGGSAVGSAKATVTTAGTRVQLAANAALGVTVRAKSSNTGLIYIGGSTVAAATGFDLMPGEAVSFDVANTNAVYADAATSGDGVSYVWVIA